MNKKFPISIANVGLLQAIVDTATRTGEIETKALTSMAETIQRENRMRRCVTYLASKEIQPIEKARITKLMRSMSRNDERSLDRIAAPYKHGDIQQMADAIRDLPLTRSEERALDTADSLPARVHYGESVGLMWDDMSEIVAKHGVKIGLKTRRIALLREPEPVSDRTSLARSLPTPA